MTAKASEVLFNSQTSVAPLGIIALEGAAELGKMIDRYLVSWAQKGGYDIDTLLIKKPMPEICLRRRKGTNRIYR